jgi:hypothetical protein
MEINEISSKLQEEINQKVLDKITFNCPYCYKEINETHLDEKGKYFQYVKEKIRKATEEEINYQRSIQKKQLLEQIEAERSYERFGEVIKDKKVIEELTKVNKELEEERLKLKDDLVKAKSYDEIRKLDGFRELEKKVDKLQNENEELKIGNQPKIKVLEKSIEELKEYIAKIKSSAEVEKLDRVKELKEKIDSYQKENEKLKLGNQPEIEKLRETIKNLEKELAETKINSGKELAKATSPDAVSELKMFKELKEERDKYQKENKNLQEQNHQLTLLSQKKLSGQELEQDFFGELTKVFGDRDRIIDIRGEVGKKADFLQEVLTEKEKPAGRIIYETKNTKDWGKDWIEKLERDMEKYQADFGFIIATCVDSGKSTKQIDPRKKIYVIGYNNNLFMVARVMREVLINRHVFKEKNNSVNKEQKLRKVEE